MNIITRQFQGVSGDKVIKLPTMSRDALSKVSHLQELCLEREQLQIRTQHILHGGLYARTIYLSKGTLLTGVLIKIPTSLIVQGHVKIYTGGNPLELEGYNVLPASAGRKQVFLALTDAAMTMVFPTDALTVEQAEHEFTDEVHLLLSRTQDVNEVIITGE